MISTEVLELASSHDTSLWMLIHAHNSLTLTHTSIPSSILNLADLLVVVVENLPVPMGNFYNSICGVEI